MCTDAKSFWARFFKCLSDGIEIVGLGAWMSGHDEDDIADNAFGSWMMTKQGLAQSKMENEEVSGRILMEVTVATTIKGFVNLCWDVFMCEGGVTYFQSVCSF